MLWTDRFVACRSFVLAGKHGHMLFLLFLDTLLWTVVVDGCCEQMLPVFWSIVVDRYCGELIVKRLKEAEFERKPNLRASRN